MLVIYVNSQLNGRSGGEGRELPPTSALEQFPAHLSTLGVKPRTLKQYRKIEIPIKIDGGNTVNKSLPDA
jgi:hypothetical protein